MTRAVVRLYQEMNPDDSANELHVNSRAKAGSMAEMASYIGYSAVHLTRIWSRRKLTAGLSELTDLDNQRLHALTRFRLVRPLATSTYWQARALAPPQPFQRIALVATFVYPRSRPQQRDPDNCIASLKEIIDSLGKAGLVVDDGPGRIDLRVAQQIGKRRRLVLEVTPLDAQTP